MLRPTTRMRTISVLVLALLGVVLVATGSQAAEPNTEETAKRLAVIESEYAKALAAIQAALPASDSQLKRLIALQTEKGKLLTDQIEQLRADKAELRAKLEQEKQELEAKLQAALKDAELKIQKLEERIPQIDLLAHQLPKAKILSVDQEQKTVQLNIGSADFVKTGLCFSVWDEGEYKPNKERKAAVEVIEVIGEHKCRAKVTEIKNAVRRPIVPGDQLYNPAWTPGMRDHVAIAGPIDLMGEGRDHTVEFIRSLEKEGKIVDAWLDLKDLAVKGKGITLHTSYLILGELPDLAEERSKDEQAKALEVYRLVTQLREDAIRRGVTIVPIHKYMALAGMPIPKVGSEAGEKKN